MACERAALCAPIDNIISVIHELWAYSLPAAKWDYIIQQQRQQRAKKNVEAREIKQGHSIKTRFSMVRILNGQWFFIHYDKPSSQKLSPIRSSSSSSSSSVNVDIFLVQIGAPRSSIFIMRFPAFAQCSLLVCVQLRQKFACLLRK